MRQKRILLILVVLLVTAVIYAWLDSPVQQRVTSGNNGSGVKERQGQTTAVKTFRRLNFNLPAVSNEEPVTFKRDIFNFYSPPRQVVKRPITPEPDIVSPPIVEQPKVPAPPSAIQPVVPQRVNFRLIGQLVKEERVVVFLGLGSELYVVRVGESFGPEDKFRAHEIRDGLLLVQEQGFDTPISVRLGQPKPTE